MRRVSLFFLIMTLFSFGHAAPRISASEITRMTGEEAEKLSSEAAWRAVRAKRNLRLQTETPAGTEDARARDAGPLARWTLPSIPAGFTRIFARILLLCAIITIALIVLSNLKNNLWSRSRAKKLSFEGGEKERGADAASRMEHAQAEADDLAKEGGFAEAIHIMLLRSVGEMRNRMRNPIAASLTSRELLRNLDLSPEEREVFGALVDSVEISYFGGREPGEEEYLACRRSFDALTALLRRYSFE
jgi:hypothetical protein